MTQISAAEWKTTIEMNQDCSLLQTADWGSVKSSFGWTTAFIRNDAAAAMILFRKLPKIALGMTIAYIPRGPLILQKNPEKINEFWTEVHQLCKSRKAIFLRVEPDAWENTPDAEFIQHCLTGFLPAFSTIQPPQTIVLPLTGTEDEWLSRMNQKTRYNIRLSQKKELDIEETRDVSSFMQLMDETGSRDNFSVHSGKYYQLISDTFSASGKCYNLVASFQGKPLGALMLFLQGKRGYYLYGASSNEERGRMPNHLLQWTAMQICARNGCTEYDLWGIPDETPEILEAQFQHRNDGLWSVYRFKRGFGGEIKRTIGSFDYPYQKTLYSLAATLDKRRKSKNSTAQETQN